MTKTMILTGDNNIPALPMTEAQVNHLRRLLAWLRCEYMLDGDMQRGFINAVVKCHETGIATGRNAQDLLQEKAEQINQVPAYVRQAHKMLSKALLEHDKRSGVVEGCRSDENLQAMPVSEKPAGALISIRTRKEP
ncbi:hypothetical protein [Comamonas sp. B21-038]|uniref:hypothetical protein n=1 Tax=Comamonas sp. B21-038 TaxID=2918299 RepID=UPI001EFA7C1C|nr:hypothetical protein [Comamonas sp. B21-038]ULR87215.1 hypothetical protein MJ205_12060 [Comamonas sp. B21-038]